jgi:ligand-binding sensor domain-containing protein
MLKLDRRRAGFLAAVATSLLSALLAGAATVDIPRTGQLVVGQNADGRLELLKVDQDGELRHRSQKASHHDWSPWSSLGAAFDGGVAVGNNSDGTLEVFVVDAKTQSLRCLRQTVPNSPDWGNWIDVEGRIRAPVTVGQNLDGRLELFAADAASHKLKHIWQTDLRNGWSRWTELTGEVEPGLAVGRNRDGRLELFGVEAVNRTVVHCWQTTANGVTTWSDWQSLGGPQAMPGLAVDQLGDGGLAVFAVNRTGAVAYVYQIPVPEGRKWSGWHSLGGSVQAGICVGQNGDGRLEVFAVGREDGKVRHCQQDYQSQANGWTNWTGWAEMGLAAQPAPAAARNQDGTLEVFAANVTNAAVVYHRRQVIGDRLWLRWSDMEHSTIQYISHTWQHGEGLPHDDVQAIAQTHDGYLWVGTRDGLARFDGVQFTPISPRNTAAMTSAFVTSLCVDHEGVLWIGTHDGLVRLKDASFSRLDQRQGLAGNEVRALYESEDGALWVGTASGVSRYRDGKFSNYTRQDGLASDVVNSIGGSRAGHLWIATEEGLHRWTEQKVDRFTIASGLPNNVVRSICRDRRGQVWIGSNNGLIACTGGEKYTFYTYNVQHGLSDSYVSPICSDRQGNLWAGTYSGLNRLREGRLFSELTSGGLPFDKVNAIFEDREGTVWIGSRDGLTRLTPKKFFLYTKREGLTHDNVTSVREDQAGNLWIGTWNGGLNQLKDDRVRAFATATGLPQDLVLSTCEGRDGSLWVGAGTGGGLARLLNGKSTHYGPQDGLINAAIRVIHEDKTGRLCLGTSQGLSCFQNGGFTNYSIKDKLAGNEVRVICEDHKGRLWFGTEGGLSWWEEGRFANVTSTNGLSDKAVNALYEDRERSLWIGTAGGGLNRVSLAESQEPGTTNRSGTVFSNVYPSFCVTSYTTRQGLFSDEIFEILEDDYGWLWMSCSRGVFRVHKTDLEALDQKKRKVMTCIAYGKSDGMESTLCNAVAKPAGWKRRDGRLWFPTTKGLIAIVPEFQLPQAPPPVFIEQVLLDKKLVSESISSGTSGRSPVTSSAAHPLMIAPGRGELEFRYTALTFQTPEKALFKYRLEGLDSDWIEAGTRRVAYYNNIYPGRYSFRVMACNSDGVWNETGALLAIQVQPHFWQTWSFRGLAVVAALGAAGALARYVTQKRLQRKLALLEQQHAIEKERGRIAKDIHDDLGSSLTFITMLGARSLQDLSRPKELAIHTGKIVGYARGAVQALDEIV